MKNNIKLNITVPGQTRYQSLIGHIGENLAAPCAHATLNGNLSPRN
jgi:hypothetical protein